MSEGIPIPRAKMLASDGIPAGFARAAVLAVFFVSGISSLIYQVVWLKYLGLVFGNTVYAAATLVAIFLAGLGVGGYLFGDRFRLSRPLIAYAVLEGVIGAIGAYSPNAFHLLDDAYIAAFRMLTTDPTLLAVARAGLAALFLLPPTILMGGTLPLLVRWFSGGEAGTGRAVAALYAVNTFGATAGVAISGFFLIPTVGLVRTIAIAVLLNFALALSALLVAWLRKEMPVREETPVAAVESFRAGTLPILVATLLMGFTSIADEVFWTRILVLHLGSSVYAFALMLFTFLVGLAIGSALIRIWIERIDVVRALALLETALAIALALQLFYFTRFADVLVWFAGLAGSASPGHALFAFLGSVLSALLIPTALMGATFPLVVRLYGARAGEGEGAAVGRVYLFNTIGSILGSLMAGFVLIRAIGSQNGLLLMALINAAVGLWFGLRSSRRAIPIAVAALSIAVVTASFAVMRPGEVLLSAGMFADSKAPVLVFREDVSATVTLRRLGPKSLSLELNGVNVAGTAPDLIGTQMLQGHLPLMIHPNAKKVVHIGFGSGGTAWAVSRHPVEQIRIVEISPEVLDVSGKRLQQVNHGVLRDPRVKVEINDGRNFIMATPEKFDVILSDSIHPRYAGNGSLYTKDYFELCRARLNPDGVISMWLPTYSLTSRNYLMILEAFREVFPNTTVWYVPNVPNAFTIVIGRMEKGPIPFDRLKAHFTPAVRAELSQIGIDDPADAAACLLLDPADVARITRGVPPHVDDLPAVEYESGRLIDRDLSWYANFRMLLRAISPLQDGFATTSETDRELLEKRGREREVEFHRHLQALSAMLRGSRAPDSR
ncbi:MAG: fused MFS/spermidine synthase [Thermoanaerobaculia bacterium]